MYAGLGEDALTLFWVIAANNHGVIYVHLTTCTLLYTQYTPFSLPFIYIHRYTQHLRPIGKRVASLAMGTVQLSIVQFTGEFTHYHLQSGILFNGSLLCINQFGFNHRLIGKELGENLAYVWVVS